MQLWARSRSSCTGTDNVKAIANLLMLTGNLGLEGTGFSPLRGQNNVQGACDLGALPNVYPGYQAIDDAASRQKFETAWNTVLSPTPGLTVVEMLNAAADVALKALYIMGENPMMSEPNLNLTRQHMEALEFLVAQDLFINESGAFADVFLPATSWAEKDGTFTNTDRRVQRICKAIDQRSD